MSLPATQTSVTITQTGGVEVLNYATTNPLPTLTPGSALIRNEYAGINYIDTYFRTGLYKATYPLTLGREAAGTVAAVSPTVTTVTPGDRVVFLGSAAYAQYTAVPAETLVKIPDGVSTEVAAAVLLQGLTAWTFIREAGNVQAGQWTLVHAAAGGVGLLLVQLLKSVGAKVIGTASSEEKRKLVAELGADVVVDSRAGDWVETVKKETGGVGVDVIFDGVGKATFDGDMEVIARKGTLISFGNASGAVPPLEIFRLTPKNIKLLRPVVNGYVATRSELEKYSGELLQRVADGALQVKIHKVYPLKEVAQAHTDIESRGTMGKLLLKID